MNLPSPHGFIYYFHHIGAGRLGQWLGSVYLIALCICKPFMKFSNHSFVCDAWWLVGVLTKCQFRAVTLDLLKVTKGILHCWSLKVLFYFLLFFKLSSIIIDKCASGLWICRLWTNNWKKHVIYLVNYLLGSCVCLPDTHLRPKIRT